MKTKIYLGGKHKKGSSRIDMELKETESGWCFSASGYYDYQYYPTIKDWDYTGCGQVISRIAKLYPNNKEVQLIKKLWLKYHLNDMNAGTPKQSKYLSSLGRYIDYDWACKELEKVDLLYDKEYNYPGQKQGYRYGSAWLYREIPKEDLQLIKKIIEKNGLE